MVAIAFLWLVAELASVNAATQFALVAMLVSSVPLVFGLQVARALMFPLMFSFFAVPVGEFMVPHMMEWTADFTVAALRLTGVPVLREGLQFVIPTGSWSVVEACSGVRYLIASFMVGTLFAYLNYQSAQRRAIFMAVSLLLPVVANWFRAYLIVMLGHLSGNKLAAGVDHIIYGWVFFGLVIGLMFMIGARWAQPDAPVPAARAPTPAGLAPTPAASWAAAGAALLLLLGTQAVNGQLNRAHDGPPPALALPAQMGAAWAAAPQPVSAWAPNFGNATVNISRSYSGPGTPVGVWIAYYRDQNYERKLITSSNTLTELVPEAFWAELGKGSTGVNTAAGSTALRTATLRGASTPGATDAQRLRVWQVYWVGGRYFTSDARAKLQGAFSRLTGQGDDAAALFFYTATGDNDTAADATLSSFVTQNLDAVTARLVAARGRP
jgi:exosortase A